MPVLGVGHHRTRIQRRRHQLVDGAGHLLTAGHVQAARRVGEVVLDIHHDECGPRVESRHACHPKGPVTQPAPSPIHAARSDREAFVWGLFLSLALIWGSSFLFIKIGLDAGMPPFTLVTWRMAMASLFLVVVLRLTGGRVPRAPGALRKLAILALVNVAMPGLLISWGEQSISSALTSILNGLTPLFTIGIAALVLRDEPITLNRLAGLLIGFGGAVLLVSPNLGRSGPDVIGHGGAPGRDRGGAGCVVLRHRHRVRAAPDHRPGTGGRSGRRPSTREPGGDRPAAGCHLRGRCAA